MSILMSFAKPPGSITSDCHFLISDHSFLYICQLFLDLINTLNIISRGQLNSIGGKIGSISSTPYGPLNAASFDPPKNIISNPLTWGYEAG